MVDPVHHLIGLTPPITVALAFALPLLSLIVKSRRFAEVYGVSATAIAAILTAIAFYYVYLVKSPVVYTFGAWPPPVGIVYEVDKFNGLLGLVVGVVFLLVAVYSIEYLKHRSGIEWYYTLLIGMEAGMLGVLYTGDVFNLFVMLEVTSVTAYGLVAFYRSRKESIEAALKYAIVGSVATTIYFIALAIIYGSYATLNMAQIAFKTMSKVDYFFYLIGGDRLWITYTPMIAVGGAAALALALWAFSVKAAIFPNHFWLPDAHPAAPSPISAILSGLLVKVGVYAIARFLYTLFHAAQPEVLVDSALKYVVEATLYALIVLGALSALIAGILMVAQSDIKRLIAYSTIMHIGYIAMGLGLATKLGLEAAVYHTVNHAVAKALLFLAAGAFIHVIGTRNIDELSGIGRYMPITTFTFVIAALSLSGLPPLNGFVSKYLLYMAFIEKGLAPLAIIIVISSAFAFISYAKIIYGAWLKAPIRSMNNIRDPSPIITIPLLILAILCIVLGVASPIILDKFITPSVEDLAYNSLNYILKALEVLNKALGG